MNTNDPAVSVVVPVRNEAGNIAPLVTEIAEALDGQWRFEVVYVNDGSSDGTDAELKRLMAQHPWLRRVRHKQSCGHHCKDDKPDKRLADDGAGYADISFGRAFEHVVERAIKPTQGAARLLLRAEQDGTESRTQRQGIKGG